MMKKIQKKTVLDLHLKGYQEFLSDLKKRIRDAQVKATLSVNRELILLYWEIGCCLDAVQKKQGWGAAVIPRLAKDLKNELPELKGFSERNISRMLAFFREYPELKAFLPQAVAKKKPSKFLPQPVAEIPVSETNFSRTMESLLLALPWGHNILLIEKVKDCDLRLWYAQKTLENGWSRNVLDH